MTLRVFDTLLAGLNCDPHLREAILGDLVELRAARAEVSGERSADRWMRGQVAACVLAFARAALWQSGLRTLAAISGAAAAAMLAILLSVALSSALLQAFVSPQVLARPTILWLAVDLAYGAAGGYLAARLGTPSPLGAALLFGVLGIIVSLMSGADAGGWYRTALLVLLTPATLASGWLRARALARANPSV